MKWTCSINYDCKVQIDKLPKTPGVTPVTKCGSPKDFNLKLESDNVLSDELISYNVIGFENYLKALLTIF